jgi:FtsH-binding integral membrane protein
VTRPDFRRRRIEAGAALVIDGVGTVVFAAIGRRSHDEAEGLGAVLTTAAPFLVALAIGWALVIALHQSRSRPSDPVQIESGVVIWIVTVAAGLLLRRTLWDRGTALAFVIVATVFLGAVIVGWRVAFDRFRRSRARA